MHGLECILVICLIVLQILGGSPTSLKASLATLAERNFPSRIDPWQGKEELFLGSGIKYKTIVFLHIQIYEVALFVEEAGAEAEFLRLYKIGFFHTTDEEVMCEALLKGRFIKLLQIKLLRSVTPSQLTDEIGKDLKPRLAMSGSRALWQRFENYVQDKSLQKGASFVALINGVSSKRGQKVTAKAILPSISALLLPRPFSQENGSASGGIFAPGFSDWEVAKPDLVYRETAFADALLDMYIGSGELVKDARAKWAEASKTFLPSWSAQ